MTAGDELLQSLKSHGYTLTAARRQICRTLAAAGGHVTADQLVDLVRQEAPQTGRMTVYRTLDLLCALGALRPVYQGTGAAHFILLHDGHHHHLVCTSCGQIIELDECLLNEVGETIGRRFQFDVQGHLLELFGLCGPCRDQGAGNGERR